MKNRSRLFLSDEMYARLEQACDQIAKRMDAGKQYSVVERKGNTYQFDQSTVLRWRLSAERREVAVWHEIMHIINVMHKELP